MRIKSLLVFSLMFIGVNVYAVRVDPNVFSPTGNYFNNVKVSSSIYADTSGNTLGITAGNYFNNVKVSSSIYADTSGAVPATGVTAGQLLDTVIVSTESILATGDASATTYLRGDASWAAPASGGGGLGAHTTRYCTLSGGGDVFIGSAAFVGCSGLAAMAESTWTIKGVRFYAIYTGSVTATEFNVARSTETGAVTTWAYLNAAPISVGTDTKSNDPKGWVLPDTITAINTGEYIALHITNIATSGTLPGEFGCIIKYWLTEGTP